MAAPIPSGDRSRVGALCGLLVLDSPPEPAFDDLTRLAAMICGVPIALVSFVDAERQWFKSRVGLDASETPRDLAFCGHAILQNELFEVPNALEDARFRSNPLVTGDPHIRFYAGMPLATPDGHNVGTLCVIDRVPRTLSAEQRDALRTLGRQVMAQLLLRQQYVTTEFELREQENFRVLFEQSSNAHLIFDVSDRVIDCNPAAVEMLRARDKSVVLGATIAALQPELQPCGRPSADYDTYSALARLVGAHRFDWSCRRFDGQVFPCEVTLTPVQLHGGDAILAVWHDLTDRKRVEDALRESEQRFRGVVDELAEGVVLIDLDSRLVVEANPAFLRLLGYTSREVLALSQYSFIAHDIDDIDDKVRHVIEHGRAHLGFRKYRRKNGTLVDVTVSASTLTLDGRAVLCLVVRDVTAEKEAADAVRASEAKFRAFMDSAPISAFMKDESGRYTYVNEPIVQRFGQPTEFWQGQTDTELFTCRYSADLRANDVAVMRGSGPVVFNEVIPTDDGGESHWTTYKFPFRDASGRLFLAGIGLDVTEKKRAEDALRASEAKFRTTVDRLAEGVFVVEPRTQTFVEANVALLNILGYTLDEFLVLSPSDLVANEAPEVVERTVEAVKAALARDGRFDMGRRSFRRKDGAVVPVEVRVSLVPSDGTGLHAVVVRDMTEQVRYEEQLFEYQASLEAANAKLKALAVTDALTGLRNRGAFNSKLGEEFERSTRYDHALSVILMDVDHFKQFNDTFGHPAGDAVLKAVAAVLQRTARSTDLVARYGGEEFVLVLPDTDRARALVMAERVRRAVAAEAWDKRAITVSVGVSTLTADTPDASALVQEADVALYRSKQAGRNRVSHGSKLVPLPSTRA